MTPSWTISGYRIDALEVGLRFPFHPVIEACLDGWRISPSQIGGCGVPDRPPTVRELGEVDDQAGKDLYFIAQMSKLLGLEAEGPLKSCWPNLANSTRVTDGPVTADTGPEAMAAAERRATELSTKVEQLKATLGESEQCRMDLELAVDSAHVELRDLWYSQR
ncbi:hypothetical protein BHE74_00026968 [Ensete ventricosum]|nr:hypothetical protein BHE74_00026968 [Ensete ventricosum]RZR80591.1 hypothetical protein BHM03_00006645 [Ensete ventricosum]